MILNVGAGEKAFGDVRLDISRTSTVTIIADAHCLPFKNEVFDEVHSHNLLEHLKNPFNALSEQKRVLRNGGRLILLTDNASYWRWHIRGKFHDPAHTGYPRSRLDKHYALFVSEHLRNFFLELDLKTEKIEYTPYLPKPLNWLDKLISRFEFSKRMAYPKIKITGIKIQDETTLTQQSTNIRNNYQTVAQNQR